MPNHRLTPFALAGVMLAASAAAFAQTAPAPATATYAPSAPRLAPSPGIRKGHRLDRALDELGLSTDQQAKIRSYRASYRTSRSTATPETRKAFLTQIKSVLTPDQLARFKTAMQHQRRAQPTTTQPGRD